MKRYLSLFFLIFCFWLSADIPETVPVAYNGRFIPLDAYARLHLQAMYGKQKIKKEDLAAFHLQDNSALNFFLKYYHEGREQFNDSPLFAIHYAELKKILGLDPKKDRFSYNQLESAIYQNKQSNLRLMQLLIPYYFIKNTKEFRVHAKSYKQELSELSNGLFVNVNQDNLVVESAPNSSLLHFLQKGTVLKENILNDSAAVLKSKIYVDEAMKLLSLLQQYSQSNETLFKALPLKNGSWGPLSALKSKTGNFTMYSDEAFSQIQNTFLNFEQTGTFEKLGQSLNEAYDSLAGTVSMQAYQKTLTYPTKWQLLAEFYYYRYPFTLITVLAYLIALIALILTKTMQLKNHWLSLSLLSFAFLLHTLILAARCFILSRPPVSNMFETVVYVPWIAMIAGFIFYYYGRNLILLIAACLSSALLLILLEVTGMNDQLENVQAVLDSQYWLIIHVLLIVGSYGVFILCGILGHLYLCRPEKFLSKFILQSMYLGVFMLIPGTILGGVWAAESWGRFWDFDPKESWAFISSCIYLIFIHAYRFHKISAWGLAVGSIIGLMSISFTWYGVNYILGTGLHSYGFGTGGDLYYYLFLLFELIFLVFVSYQHKKHLELKNRNMI